MYDKFYISFLEYENVQLRQKGEKNKHVSFCTIKNFV